MKFAASQVIAFVAAVAFGKWMGNVYAAIFLWSMVQTFYMGIDHIGTAIDAM